MKNKAAFSALITCCFICVFAVRAKAQLRTMRLDNTDISVTLKTQKIAPNSGGTQKLVDNLYTQMYVGNDKAIPRVIADPESGSYFGYDLEVSFDSVTRKISLSIKPLSINPNLIMEKPLKDLALKALPNYPNALVVEDGDTVVLDILEDPRTKVKIVDTISVRILSPNTVTPKAKPDDQADVSQSTKDFAPETLRVMQLTDVRIFVNGSEVANPGGLSGPIMYFYVPEKGRFIFSLLPQKGYGFQRIGTLEGNEISFTTNGDTYKLVSSLPIVAATGRWNLWVLLDRNFRPDPRFARYSPYWMGVANRVEDFLERKERE